MSNKAELGTKGEQIAGDYLMSKGYDIIRTNYRYKHAEIDLIAKLNGLLIFVEVKTRTNLNFGYPEDFVDDKKANKVMEGAEQYTYENNWDGDIRFDVVAITIKNGEPDIAW